MLGLILIYSIGRYFFRLAEKHERSKWGFAILSIVVYYGSQFLFVFAGMLIMFGMGMDEDFSGGTELLLTIGGIGFGLLATWLFYYLLEKSWAKSHIDSQLQSELLDSNDILDEHRF